MPRRMAASTSDRFISQAAERRLLPAEAAARWPTREVISGDAHGFCRCRCPSHFASFLSLAADAMAALRTRPQTFRACFRLRLQEDDTRNYAGMMTRNFSRSGAGMAPCCGIATFGQRLRSSRLPLISRPTPRRQRHGQCSYGTAGAIAIESATGRAMPATILRGGFLFAGYYVPRPHFWSAQKPKTREKRPTTAPTANN